jgi:hypothetical protein
MSRCWPDECTITTPPWVNGSPPAVRVVFEIRPAIPDGRLVHKCPPKSTRSAVRRPKWLKGAQHVKGQRVGRERMVIGCLHQRLGTRIRGPDPTSNGRESSKKYSQPEQAKAQFIQVIATMVCSWWCRHRWRTTPIFHSAKSRSRQ